MIASERNVLSTIVLIIFSLSCMLYAPTARQRTSALVPRAQIYQCGQTQRGVLERTLRGIERLALRATVLTVDPQFIGDDNLLEKFVLHFKENTQETRRIVGQRFQAIADEARSLNGGRVPITCIDLQDRCIGNLRYAYVDDTGYIIVICPLFYQLPPYQHEYYDDDAISVLTRELTLLRSIAPINGQPVMIIPPQPPGGPLWEDVSPEAARQNANAYAFFVKNLLQWFLRRRRSRERIQAAMTS